jgi:hypothetical protein
LSFVALIERFDIEIGFQIFVLHANFTRRETDSRIPLTFQILLMRLKRVTHGVRTVLPYIGNSIGATFAVWTIDGCDLTIVSGIHNMIMLSRNEADPRISKRSSPDLLDKFAIKGDASPKTGS